MIEYQRELTTDGETQFKLATYRERGINHKKLKFRTHQLHFSTRIRT